MVNGNQLLTVAKACDMLRARLLAAEHYAVMFFEKKVGDRIAKHLTAEREAGRPLQREGFDAIVIPHAIIDCCTPDPVTFAFFAKKFWTAKKICEEFMNMPGCERVIENSEVIQITSSMAAGDAVLDEVLLLLGLQMEDRQRRKGIPDVSRN
jgi:hypothetical protein